MSAIGNSTSASSQTSQQLALAQAQAQLAADEAAQAAADVIKSDQKAVDDAEQAQSKNLVDIKA
jgi:hypothetical protein